MKTEKQRIAWWQRGLSFALSLAMVMASTPTAALAEALDEAGSEVALVETVDDEVIADDEGIEASGDGEAAVAEAESIDEDEDAAEVAEGEASEAADELVAPEAAPEETITSDDEATAEEAEPVAEAEPAAEAEDDLDAGLKAQSLSFAGDLALNGEWVSSDIEGTDVDAYDAATDSDGRIAALTSQVWRITLSQSGTLSADIWSKSSKLHWWFMDADFKAISSEKTVDKGASNTLSISAAAGTYYVFVASVTASSGNYALRAYTAKRALTRATFNGKTSANISTLANKVYTGVAQKPAVTVKYGSTKLTKGIDYTIAYAANKKVGTASITIKGKGLYSGTKVIKFKIVKRSIKKTKVTIGIKPWTSKLVKPNPVVKIGKVKLKKGVDYTIVKYANNKNVGTAKVVIKGKGGLKGTRVIKFKIRYNIGRNKAVVGKYTPGTTTFNRFIFVKTKATMKSGRDYRLSVIENSSSKKVYKMVGKGMYYGTTYFTFYK